MIRGDRPDRYAEPRLPIFEQVQQSRWFTTASELALGAKLAEGVGSSAGAAGSGPFGGDPGGGAPRASSTWLTSADDGWQAAARAAMPQPAGTTHSGLPVRQPGAQLVPGGVDNPVAAGPGPVPEWRDPVQVSAVAAAYSRGLSTGRAQHATLVRSQAAPTHGNGAPR